MLRMNFIFKNIGNLISDTNNYFKGLYFPYSGKLDTLDEAKEFSDKLFPRIANLFSNFGFETYYGISSNIIDDFSLTDYAALSRTLTIIFNDFENDGIGISLLYSPIDDGGYGLVISPFGDISMEISKYNWNFKATLSSQIEGFSVNSNGVQFPSNFENTSLSINIIASRLFNTITPNQSYGSTIGSRIEIGNMTGNVFGDFAISKNDYGIL